MKSRYFRMGVDEVHTDAKVVRVTALVRNGPAMGILSTA